jgi:hypothetical protein
MYYIIISLSNVGFKKIECQLSKNKLLTRSITLRDTTIIMKLYMPTV